MAAISAMSACTFGLGKVANLLGQSARMAKTARTLRSAASLIGNVGSFAANASGLMSTGFSMYEKYVIQEQEMNDSTLLEVVGLGMSAIGCIMSGRGVSNDVRQLGSMLGDADFMNVMRNEIAQLGCDVKTNVSGGRRVYCFVAGTLVHTPEGKTAIEDIEPGEHVLSYNEETGETGYKEVVQLFRNTTEELAHVQVEGMEEILCTPGHKFYVQGEWIAASELTTGDILTMADGTTAEVISVTLEELETPVTIYNFEVADWHNYYVGDSGVLVHNNGCGGSGTGGSGPVNVDYVVSPNGVVEAVGNRQHILERHVGLSDAQLISRLNSNPRITGASTFTDDITANTVVNAALSDSQNISRINAWLSQGANGNLPISYVGNNVIGRGASRGSNIVFDMSNAKIILKSNGNGGYDILTAYPVQ